MWRGGGGGQGRCGSCTTLLTWHWDGVWRVDGQVAGKLRALDEVEDDGVLEADERGADALKRQRRAHVGERRRRRRGAAALGAAGRRCCRAGREEVPPPAAAGARRGGARRSDRERWAGAAVLPSFLPLLPLVRRSGCARRAGARMGGLQPRDQPGSSGQRAAQHQCAQPMQLRRSAQRSSGTWHENAPVRAAAAIVLSPMAPATAGATRLNERAAAPRAAAEAGALCCAEASWAPCCTDGHGCRRVDAQSFSLVDTITPRKGASSCAAMLHDL